MTTFLLIIHVLVCVFLIFVVLVQGGKGAELGAAFGGSSQTLFGSRGAASFLSKLTTGVAIVFMVTSLLLAVLSTQPSSIVKQQPMPAGRPTSPMQQQAPATPGQSAPVQPAQQSSPLAPQSPSQPAK